MKSRILSLPFRVLIAVLTTALGWTFAHAGENAFDVQRLDLEQVRFFTLSGSDIKTELRERDAAALQGWSGGVYVVPKTDSSVSIGVQYAEARKQYGQKRLVEGRLQVPQKRLTMVGRLPGDGTGAQSSFSTAIGKPRDFFQSDKTLFLLGSCKFEGPFLNGEPKPQAFYFTADIPILPPGKYSAIVRVSPEGEVFEKLKKSKEYQLPDFSLLRCDFEVEGKK